MNRMTFYYHFKDIYDLVDWILTEDAIKAMEGCQSFDTWTEHFWTSCTRSGITKHWY
mgnify:CR=1 FL=1